MKGVDLQVDAFQGKGEQKKEGSQDKRKKKIKKGRKEARKAWTYKSTPLKGATFRRRFPGVRRTPRWQGANRQGDELEPRQRSDKCTSWSHVCFEKVRHRLLGRGHAAPPARPRKAPARAHMRPGTVPPPRERGCRSRSAAARTTGPRRVDAFLEPRAAAEGRIV